MGYEALLGRYRAVAEIVKRGNAVGLRPDPDAPRSRNVLVVSLDVDLAVERDANSLAGELHAQRVPLILRHRRVRILDRDPTSILRVIERDVVFQRVGPGDVIVVAVLPTPDDTARLVLFAGDCLELHLDIAIGQLGFVLYAPREVASSALLQYIGLGRGAGVGFDGPAMGAAARDAGGPTWGGRPCGIGIKIDRFRHGHSFRQDVAKESNAKRNQDLVHRIYLPLYCPRRVPRRAAPERRRIR